MTVGFNYSNIEFESLIGLVFRPSDSHHPSVHISPKLLSQIRPPADIVHWKDLFTHDTAA